MFRSLHQKFAEKFNILANWKELYCKDFHRVHYLLDTEGNFITYHSITNDYSIQIPFTTYEGLKQAIIHSWPNIKLLLQNITFQPYQPEFVKILCKYKIWYKNHKISLPVKTNGGSDLNLSLIQIGNIYVQTYHLWQRIHDWYGLFIELW
jgi:uncharacterized membrane protein